MYTEKYIIQLDNINTQYYTCSIAIDRVVVNENNVIVGNVEPRQRCSFNPRQLQNVIEYLNEKAPNTDTTQIINVLNALWTEDVITQYINLINQLENING